MSTQIVVAKENTNAEQISSKLLAGEFNGLPVVDDNDYVVGIVTAIDILKAIQSGHKLNAMVAKDRDYSLDNSESYSNTPFEDLGTLDSPSDDPFFSSGGDDFSQSPFGDLFGG